MNYNYPDPNDIITHTKIKEYECTDSDYWGRSEGLIIDRVLSIIEHEAGERESMLDVGCGEGRLISRFNTLYNNVTAIDPDINRLKNVDKSLLDDNVTVSVDTISKI